MENIGSEIYRKQYPEWVKCPGCNWEVSTLYSFREDNIDEEGLCAHCFIDMLVDEDFRILTNEELESLLKRNRNSLFFPIPIAYSFF